MNQQAGCASRLMAHADHASADAHLFATLIAARESRDELGLLGLASDRLERLCARHFGAARPTVSVVMPNAAKNAGFVDALVSMLTEHTSSSVDPDDAACLATIIARACLRPDHLWRDLGLDGRDDVTRMLRRYFPWVIERNIEGLRWKKLLARELALSLGIEPQPAPGCPGCEDFGQCYRGVEASGIHVSWEPLR
jgi:nitrogen fixation protein NifQ